MSHFPSNILLLDALPVTPASLLFHLIFFLSGVAYKFFWFEAQFFTGLKLKAPVVKQPCSPSPNIAFSHQGLNQAVSKLWIKRVLSNVSWRQIYIFPKTVWVCFFFSPWVTPIFFKTIQQEQTCAHPTKQFLVVGWDICCDWVFPGSTLDAWKQEFPRMSRGNPLTHTAFSVL